MYHAQPMYIKDFGETRGKGQYSKFRYTKLRVKEREEAKEEYVENSEAERTRCD